MSGCTRVKIRYFSIRLRRQIALPVIRTFKAGDCIFKAGDDRTRGFVKRQPHQAFLAFIA